MTKKSTRNEGGRRDYSLPDCQKWEMSDYRLYQAFLETLHNSHDEKFGIVETPTEEGWTSSLLDMIIAAIAVAEKFPHNQQLLAQVKSVNKLNPTEYD